MARKKYNPSQSLGRFILGIYDYYTDRGMPQDTAKVRMVDNTFNEVVELMRHEKEVPDQMLVVMAQFTARALNNRGAQITKHIKDSKLDTTVEQLQPLHDIKAAKDAIDIFIENYKGWSETDGKSES